MASDAQLTPMMAQYRRIKSELPKDALLLFRLGDFYEMFFEDAQVGAQLLNVALTKRGVIPMCGDRKSTRLNSSHTVISYAVFCLKKKKIDEYFNLSLSTIIHIV